MIRLNGDQIVSLLRQPESGMGFQVVSVHTRAQEERKYAIVLNADLVLYAEDYKGLTEQRSGHSYQELRASAATSSDILELQVLKDGIAPTGGFGFSIAKWFFSRKSAASAEVTHTGKGDRFKRFSAYRNDRRITDSNGLVPGTYATTESDATNVTTGKEAVARYALPNDEPAIYVFAIGPPEATTIKEGIAQPNFNQPGGGVEILFVNGSPDNTVSGPSTIPSG